MTASVARITKINAYRGAPPPTTGKRRDSARTIPFVSDADQPAIDLNKKIVDQYRAEMKKYYYDPTKFKTYLDQLGIKYREPAK